MADFVIDLKRMELGNEADVRVYWLDDGFYIVEKTKTKKAFFMAGIAVQAVNMAMRSSQKKKFDEEFGTMHPADILNERRGMMFPVEDPVKVGPFKQILAKPTVQVMGTVSGQSIMLDGKPDEKEKILQEARRRNAYTDEWA